MGDEEGDAGNERERKAAGEVGDAGKASAGQAMEWRGMNQNLADGGERTNEQMRRK